jgi:hypothetical protein
MMPPLQGGADGMRLEPMTEELRSRKDTLVSFGRRWLISPIVDTSGIIRFVYSNPDFRVRLSAQETWKAALPFAPKAQAK